MYQKNNKNQRLSKCICINKLYEYDTNKFSYLKIFKYIYIFQYPNIRQTLIKAITLKAFLYQMFYIKRFILRDLMGDERLGDKDMSFIP